MDWISTIQGIMAIIGGGLTIISTAIAIIVSIVGKIKERKQKTWQENLQYLKDIADKGMEQAEASTLKGEDKKSMTLNVCSAAAEAAGIENFASFVKDLSSYIDNSIIFFNQMKKSK